MEQFTLNAEKRDGIGKGVARKLRMKGYIPGVLYGPDIKSERVSIKTISVSAFLRKFGRSSRLIDLDINGDSRKVVIRELQKDPVSGALEHIDLYQVSMTRKLTLTVGLELTGTPEGATLGGILQHIVRDIEIACLPGDIPDKIEVDVSALEIGDSIHVSDISVDKVDILIDPKRTIATVVPPTVVKTAAEEAAEKALEEGEEAELAEGEVAEGEEGEAKPAEGDDVKKDEGKKDKK
jgi:large subunit ribosomal protein L25